MFVLFPLAHGRSVHAVCSLGHSSGTSGDEHRAAFRTQQNHAAVPQEASTLGSGCVIVVALAALKTVKVSVASGNISGTPPCTGKGTDVPI